MDYWSNARFKTPLSSIYGYALLLESKQYNWTDRDIQQFGSVMKEKSQYMTTLIDDLSLTYQLKITVFLRSM